MSAIVIPDKTCKKCEGNIWYKSSKGFVCKTCSYNQGKNHYRKNPEKYKIRVANYLKTPKGKLTLKRFRDKESINLTDGHIKKTIYTVISHSSGELIDMQAIPQEQVERYRLGIQTLRMNREVNKQLKTQKMEATEVKELTSAQKRSLAMKQSWEKRKLTSSSLAAIADASAVSNKSNEATPVTSRGALETLFEDLKNLTDKKQEILHHLEAIKNLVNQF